MTTATKPRSRRSKLLAGMAAALCLAGAAFAPAASATYGDSFAMADSQGAMPGPKAFWAGSCDLSSSAVAAGTAPSTKPRECLDPGTLNLTVLSPTAWSTPPAYRLASVDGAGAHPNAGAALMISRDYTNESGNANLAPLPSAVTRSVFVKLPVGLAGNVESVPACPNADFERFPPTCPPQSQVGVTIIRVNFLEFAVNTDILPVYRLETLPGKTAEFGIPMAGDGVAAVRILASARTDSDYGVNTAVEEIPTGYPLMQQALTFWGVPWASSHDPWRPKAGVLTRQNKMPADGLASSEQAHYEQSWGPIQPFVTNPTRCDGSGAKTSLWLDSWQKFGGRLANGEPDPSDPDWVTTDAETPAIEGCEKVPFDPTISVQPKSRTADSPSAYDIDLATPQNNKVPGGVGTDPSATGAPAYWKSDAGLATSHLKDSVVTLPKGVVVNPSAGDGLGACSEAQVGLIAENPLRFDKASPTCPDSAKIGSAEIETPLLTEVLDGSVYLATPHDNPFGSLLALYLTVEEPERGLYVKLPGKVVPDPVTGQLMATFENNPQLPFDHLRLHIKGGPRASLANPAKCGVTTTTTTTLTPWSGNAPATPSDDLTIDQGPNGAPCPSGALNPSLSAGIVNPLAGSTSPFVTRITRPDGSGRIAGLDLALPKGLTAYIKDVPYCSSQAIAAAEAKTGKAELAAASCPAASQVGSVDVGSGAGTSPLYVSGRAYLSGPYKGAPLSLAIITPAVAGPFDLGNVVVRAALKVDPTSAQITAVSDAVPTILQGIPLNIRDIRVNIDRPAFTVAPTSCEAMAVTATVHGESGGTTSVSNRFQVGDCANLGFKPKLALRFSGPTHRSAYPKLRAELTARPGDANIGKATVILPKTEFLENAHIETICTRVQYAAHACPARSVYGYARAWSPLLAEPLQGPVYLRSSDNELPDLVASLDGQIHIDLVGRIDSVRERIRNTFEAVPDAPVSKFVLTMQGGKKGLLVNNTELCKTKPRATALFDAQSGKTHDIFPLVKTECGKRGKK